ncbi:MAG: geranylgeranylglycerol-phosphate geranylgeranyltransferase [Gloeobacteraceae cyanobacterium ES-bin-316]|nr:geranylgeranylglycerol-phosphate geranylgeranyltransferase [Ferruginibacter sp.]
MKLVAAFFKLIRWPNLLFIALTQGLFYFCVFEKTLLSGPASPADFLFYMLVAASVMIAAAGYIINDYFDLHIDAINKPGKVVVDKILKRRWAIVWHWLLSGAGLLLSFYISYKLGNWIIFLANTGVVLLLWFYSTTFKKRILSGNIIIAALTAWVIVVVYFFCGADIEVWPQQPTSFDAKRFFKFTILYAGFAFIISLIREVVKDIEDMEGDARYHCRTMPIVWGVPTSKVFTAVWLVVCIAALAIVQLYAWQLGWWFITIYTVVLIILPLVFILRNLYKATVPADYHQLSSLVKFVMLAGILSMLFFIF